MPEEGPDDIIVESVPGGTATYRGVTYVVLLAAELAKEDYLNG